MHVGIFGGSFNPPHICHVLASVWALETQSLDEVWWIPTYQHAFSKKLLEFEPRMEMCRRATDSYDGIALSDVERRLGGESRTIDTMRALSDEYEDYRFSLLIGSDILEETDKWKAWDELVEQFNLIVIGRAGHSAEEAEQDVEFELPDISSTRTRRALKERDFSWLNAWIPESVLEYITDHELYLDPSEV